MEESKKFELVSNYAPAGDQPEAIRRLIEGFEAGLQCQTLLGVTGSGKTLAFAIPVVENLLKVQCTAFISAFLLRKTLDRKINRLEVGVGRGQQDQ